MLSFYSIHAFSGTLQFERKELTFLSLVMVCRLGRYAVESYLEQILSHGFFHADPVSFHCLPVIFGAK